MCVQKGEKENRGWTHWIEGDMLHLVRDGESRRVAHIFHTEDQMLLCYLSSVKQIQPHSQQKKTFFYEQEQSNSNLRFIDISHNKIM